MTIISSDIEMSSLQNHPDVTNDPVSGDETVEHVASEDEEAGAEDTRVQPWKGFWPPPPSGKSGFPYDVKPGDIVTIGGN
ncbi:hypothetical protein McanCB56680_004119 [Microsporum canis]